MAAKKMRKKKLSPMELSEFCRQIASMTGAGITLSGALKILEEGTDNKRFAGICRELQEKMRQGSPASAAMESAGIFPELMVNMFRAGEASGKVKEVSAKLAKHYQREHRMNSRIRSALLYPEILAVTAVAAVLMIFLIVVPAVEPLFEKMELPLLTRILMAFSRFIREKWYFAILIALSPSVLWNALMRNGKARFLWDKIKLHLPVIGKQLRIIYTFRFAGSQSSLYSGGLPMLESLRIAGTTLGNRYLESQFLEVARKVQNGEMLSSAIKAADGLDRKLAPVILVGEETGKLDEMLENIADSYEYDSDIALTKLISLIEPAMILVMGAIIGLILLGIMLPLWNMYGYIE